MNVPLTDAEHPGEQVHLRCEKCATAVGSILAAAPEIRPTGRQISTARDETTTLTRNKT